MSNLRGARIRRELLASVCVLAAVLSAVGSKSAAAQSAVANGTETVVVTAEKRAEDVQTVPVPVTALSADDLLKSNDTRVQDYFSQIPGLSYAPGFVGQPFLVIRGVTTGASSTANPTVGVMIDDVPYGSSTGLGGGGFGAPDIDPGDLQRV